MKLKIGAGIVAAIGVFILFAVYEDMNNEIDTLKQQNTVLVQKAHADNVDAYRAGVADCSNYYVEMYNNYMDGLKQLYESTTNPIERQVYKGCWQIAKQQRDEWSPSDSAVDEMVQERYGGGA